jgi:hypothetical protein
MFHNDLAQRPIFGRRKEPSETDRLYKELTGKEPKPVDTTQYNYGRNIPWFKLGPTPEYHRTYALARALAAAAQKLSQASWELDEACKHVRNAQDMGERARAMSALAPARTVNDLLGIDGTFNQANMPDDYKPSEPEDYVFGENI